MYRTEELQQYTCAACGQSASPSERIYAFGSDEEVRCFACGVSQDGVYDERSDRWSTPPRCDDLLSQRPD